MPVSNKMVRAPILVAAIIAISLSVTSAEAQNFGKPGLVSGNYCTNGAVANVRASNRGTVVRITGQFPDRRGVSGYARNGFSGEGFSITPLGGQSIRIVQYQFGADRTFTRC